MKSLLKVEIDPVEVKRMCHEQIGELVKAADAEYAFWDSKELMKRTCMSWNTIQDMFFHDPRFIKRKVGQKWYFPAKETREFLRQWLLEQSPF
ncbi:group-specific protein [Saccharibacillus brassicae]|uniref:Group-specific protein n=1 Tax=Saccharibacillus brassicae TaxID=2583377 RepID=A0A4Y6V494_SACBS|nr:group-specific protein [Saccharibacillus brassicae]QDH23500.1 group-specific protein [Saccharibacillus brassicae]